MSTIQVLILSIFIAFLILENYGYGYWMISRPIFAGPLIGLLLGDVQTGLLVGGSVELMYMGVIPVSYKEFSLSHPAKSTNSFSDSSPSCS